MKMKPLLLAVVALVLLVSLEVEAGVSFHPRPKEKISNRSGNMPKSSSKRQVYDDVALQVEEGHSNSAAAQVEVPPQLGLTKSKVDSEQLGELLMQVLSSLLGSDGCETRLSWMVHRLWGVGRPGKLNSLLLRHRPSF